MSRHGWPNARILSAEHLAPKSTRSWLSVEVREADQGRFLVVRRMSLRFDGEWVSHRGVSVRLDEVAKLLRALREAATLAVTGGER